MLVQTCDNLEELRKLRKPTAKELYHYWTLKCGWFRLLIVEPSPNPQYRIFCSILHRPINEGRDFEALSYTWGTGEAIVQILIDGGVAFIQSHLYCALISLRLSTNAQVLRVDALCINLADTAERSCQVSQMREVYSHAREIIVWLGEGNE